MIEFQFVNGYIASPSNKVQPNGEHCPTGYGAIDRRNQE